MTELETNKRAVRVQRADIAFFALAHFSSPTLFRGRFFTYTGVPLERKPTEKNLGNQYFDTAVFELEGFFSSVLNKNRNVDEH